MKWIDDDDEAAFVGDAIYSSPNTQSVDLYLHNSKVRNVLQFSNNFHFPTPHFQSQWAVVECL